MIFMSTMFDRFSKMAKEEFGCTVRRNEMGSGTTFESLFGVPTKSLAEYELPYDVSVIQFIYCNESETSRWNEGKILENDFNFEKFLNFAA